MTDEELKTFSDKLRHLKSQCSNAKQEKKLQEKFRELAGEVGASTGSFFITNCNICEIKDATTSELMQNIHQALQTASMVNMCRTASQGYEMATKASKSASRTFWIAAAIASVSALAACASAVVALVAVVWN